MASCGQREGLAGPLRCFKSGGQERAELIQLLEDGAEAAGQFDYEALLLRLHAAVDSVATGSAPRCGGLS